MRVPDLRELEGEGTRDPFWNYLPNLRLSELEKRKELLLCFLSLELRANGKSSFLLFIRRKEEKRRVKRKGVWTLHSNSTRLTDGQQASCHNLAW